MSKLRLSAKLPIYMVALVFAAQLVLGLVAYTKSSGQLVDASQDKQLALVKARAGALETYLKTLREDIANMAENQQMIEAALDFQYTLEFGDKSEALQEIRAAYPVEKGAQTEKGDKSRYSGRHQAHHPVFRKFIERRGYQDLIMVDAQGDVVYTVRKGPEYTARLTEGEWKDSVLARMFEDIKAHTEPNYKVFSGILEYAPDDGAPAGFIGAPMLDGENFMGALIFRMPMPRINGILQNEVGMGETGDAYLVGSDKLMRSASRLLDEPTALNTRVDTAPAEKALAGETGVMQTEDFRGRDVVAAYTPISFLGVQWAVVAEIGTDEVLAPVADMRTFMIIATILIMAVAIGAGILVSRSVAGAIANMTRATTHLAEGDLSVDVPYRKRSDEIGEMAGAVQVFKDNAVKLKQMAAEQEALHRRNARKLKTEMFAMTNALDEEVRGAIGIVQQQSEAMHEAATEMAQAVSQTEQRSDAAAAASKDAATSVDAVAAAAEQLSSSITEISQQVSSSTAIAQRAVDEADSTNHKIQGLADAASKIGEVVDLISDIAEQTNLLALNATIEAARAGEAGKGFAVVASEVKNLANQTAKATEEIASQIGGMQSATREAVEAIQGIGKVIGEINEITTAVAAAVEEQNAATREISNNAQQASRSTQESSENISEVSASTDTTGQHSREVKESAQEVRERVHQMQESLERIMSSGSEEDRVANELHTVNVAVTIDMGGGDSRSCLLQDLALSGVGTLDRALDGERGQDFTLELPDLGSVHGSIVAKTENATHIRLDIDEAQMEQLERFVADRQRRAG